MKQNFCYNFTDFCSTKFLKFGYLHKVLNKVFFNFIKSNFIWLFLNSDLQLEFFNITFF